MYELEISIFIKAITLIINSPFNYIVFSSYFILSSFSQLFILLHFFLSLPFS